MFPSIFFDFVFAKEYTVAFPPYLACQLTRLFTNIQFRLPVQLILYLSVTAPILCFSVDKNLNFFSPLPSYQLQYSAVVLVA